MAGITIPFLTIGTLRFKFFIFRFVQTVTNGMFGGRLLSNLGLVVLFLMA